MVFMSKGNYKISLRLAALILAAACGDKPPTGTDTGINLRIEAMYVVQSVQSREGAVPLVANKDGYLRVFVLANAANSLKPRSEEHTSELQSHVNLVCRLL